VQVASCWVAVGLLAASLSAVSLSAVSLSAAAASAEPLPRPGIAPGVSLPPLRLPPLPGLSAAQRKELDELHQKTQLQLAPLRAALWLRNQELDALWASESPSREQVLEKVSQLDVIRARMREILLEQRLTLIARLNPEQRAAFRAQLSRPKPAPHPGQKGDVLGLEECMSTGDCATAPPPAPKPR
jgi:Spy/CpxP family protein refolding chaperone